MKKSNTIACLTAILLLSLLYPVAASAQWHSTPRWNIGSSPRDINGDKVQQPALLHKQPFLSDSGALLIDMARIYLGTPYHYGGKTPKGFDCAGYALFLYRHFGYQLAPYSGGQYRQGRKISNKELRPGDLVFFGGRHSRKAVGHTGIVVDADSTRGTFRFIHSTTGRGVIISNSTEAYYKQRYIGACRIFK